MSNLINQLILKEFAKNDISILNLIDITSGRNSSVYRLESNDKIYICKHYPSRFEQDNSRLMNEFSTLEFLNKHGIIHIPKPLFYNKLYNFAAYTFLEGYPINEVNKDVLAASVDFYKKLSKFSYSNYKEDVVNAAEACFSPTEHFNLIKQRITNLLSTSQSTILHTVALRWVRDELLARYNDIRERAYTDLGSSYLNRQLRDKYKIISQSDVGIHNMIKSNDDYLFYDFEYAGWDDPSKFLVDWILQPEQLLNLELSNQLILTIESYLDDQYLIKKMPLMLNLYRIKWCTIILNPYLHKLSSEIQLEESYNKAVKYFSRSQFLVEQLTKLFLN